MTEKMFDGPMRDLMVTMSAWRRLYTKAKELIDDRQVLGAFLLQCMGEAWDEAEEDLKKGEKDLRKQMKKEAKE